MMTICIDNGGAGVSLPSPNSNSFGLHTDQVLVCTYTCIQQTQYYYVQDFLIQICNCIIFHTSSHSAFITRRSFTNWMPWRLLWKQLMGDYYQYCQGLPSLDSRRLYHLLSPLCLNPRPQHLPPSPQFNLRPQHLLPSPQLNLRPQHPNLDL